MPTEQSEKLPQKKLREVLGQTITIERIFTGVSRFGPYALLITKDASIISSGKVVLSQVEELRGNLPATVTVTKIAGKNHEYFSLA